MIANTRESLMSREHLWRCSKWLMLWWATATAAFFRVVVYAISSSFAVAGVFFYSVGEYDVSTKQLGKKRMWDGRSWLLVPVLLRRCSRELGREASPVYYYHICEDMTGCWYGQTFSPLPYRIKFIICEWMARYVDAEMPQAENPCPEMTRCA